MKKISVLVPTYNEEENVIPLSEKIIEQFETELTDYDYELIFIDNDSKDSTREKIRGLCRSNPRIKAIFNARNFGQFSSPYYGLLQTTGDCTISLCADFQDPVELIPVYVREWESGYKIVLGQKTTSKENRLVRAARNAYYRFMRKNSDVDYLEHVTGSGLFDREFIEVLRGIDEPRPLLRGMIAELGYGIKLVPYDQQRRRAGKSSNNIFRYYDAAVQSFTSYTKIGVRLAVFLGVISTAVSVLTALGFVIYTLLNWGTFDIMPFALELAIFVVVSLQLLFIGIVGEYVLNINSRMKKRPLVIESERINF